MQIKNLTEKDYRALPKISQGDLKLINKAPLFYKLRETLNVRTSAMDFGIACHAALLTPSEFKANFVVMPKFSGKTAKGEITFSKNATDVKAKMAAFELENQGKVIIEESDVERITGICNTLLQDETCSMLLTGGESEVSFEFEHRGHQCKGRLDKLHLDHPLFGKTVIEFKTTRDASPEAFTREVANFGYDFQAAFYSLALRPQRYFCIAIEKEFPFAFGVYDMSQWIELGEKKVEKAFDKLEYCLENNVWPGYTESLEQLQPPSWEVAMSQEN